MTLIPSVGHAGHRNLIAYICLADALDRNGKVMIFWGWGCGNVDVENVQYVCLILPDTRPTYVSVKVPLS